jgi:hypothetical protein
MGIFISNSQKCFLIISYVFSPTKSEGRTGSAWKLGVGGEVAQIVYTHVNKHKNDKIKKNI